MKDQPDFIDSELVDERYPGAVCMYGNCYPANFFTKDQWDAVYELAANIVTNEEFYHEKEIKLLRSKHRKVVKKLKEELNGGEVIYQNGKYTNKYLKEK